MTVLVAELNAIDYVQAKTMNVLAIRLPSEAHFSHELSVYTVFGIPMSVSSGGLAMDVDRQYSMVKAFDGDKEKPKQFFLNSGMNGSALEHSVPEQLFSTPENPAEGISAVKALKIANDEGIPIYTIDQSNIDTILPQLQVDAGTKADIQNAVNAGMVATVSKTEITYNGWTGVGYIIIDSETGAGAYMISGGTSGSWLFWVGVAGLVIAIIAVGLICLFSGICAVIAAALISVIGAIISALSTLILWLSSWATVLYLILYKISIVAFIAINVNFIFYCYQFTPPGSSLWECYALRIGAFIMAWYLARGIK